MINRLPAVRPPGPLPSRGRSFPLRIRLAGALCAGLILALASPAPGLTSASGDFLLQPALFSPKALRALLLGLARAGHRLVAVGERGVVLCSEDEGASWRQSPMPVSVTLTAVQFPTADRGYAVGHDGVVMATDDGGRTWSRRFDGNRSNALMEADASLRLERLQARGGATADETALAENALDDARAAARFGPSHPLLGLWFESADRGVVVGSYGQIFRTADGGTTWESLGLRLDDADGLHLNAVTATSDGVWLVVGEGGRIYRSTDGGDHWTRTEVGGKGAFLGIKAWRDRDGKSRILAYGFGGRVFRSLDDGRTWDSWAGCGERTVVDAVIGSDGQPMLVDGASTLVTGGFDGQACRATPLLSQAQTEAALPLAANRLALAGPGGIHMASFSPMSR
ncbi:MAG: glycosyl hydrolase [Telmatospirillum sp.]|nr:glycosyl hydrolase [Telmatospirillum sp.]